jgi:hypothetical protein
MEVPQRSRLETLVRSMPVLPPAGYVPSDDGPYVSDSTVAMLGRGKVLITPRYVTAFAHLLGYPPGDMVALTGVGPDRRSPRWPGRPGGSGRVIRLNLVASASGRKAKENAENLRENCYPGHPGNISLGDS